MNKNRSGFTMVELLVVITIIGIMAILSMQIGRNVIQRTSSTNAINTLIADISSIKQLAVKENRYFAIQFNTDGASYRIQRQTTIGILSAAGWTDISTKKPLDGKEFFDGTKIVPAWQGFAVNPMGVIYTRNSTGISATPLSQNFNCYMKYKGKKDYDKNIIIYANGGIKIE